MGITLVDSHERFVFKPLLYELLAGTADEQEVAPPFRTLLRSTDVIFARGEPEGVFEVREDGVLPGGAEAGAGAAGSPAPGPIRVALRGGGALDCDWLVLALGARPSVAGVPGVEARAHLFWGYEDAVRLRAAVGALRGGPPARVAVVGAGYAGSELAAVLADLLPRGSQVSLLSGGGTILPGAPPGQRDIATEALREKGVRVDFNVRVQAVEESKRGGIVTDASLRVQGTPNIFALGDVAVRRPGQSTSDDAHASLPATAQVALQQAHCVAENLAAAMEGPALGSIHLPSSRRHDVPGPPVRRGDPARAPAAPAGGRRAARARRARALRALGFSVHEGAEGAAALSLEGPLAAAVRRLTYLYRQPTPDAQGRAAVSIASRALTDAVDLAGSFLRQVRRGVDDARRN
ncbi:hypothetical protein QBZ16_002212 [Prototheca wickerhamii]|uniref:FAD/NAD(P)-binding domain-containing protein n=1 Tax=Prototheca wickerhamii TaxID=3111 RepID=A0AAD9MJF8_PROWI|nr:hypothetical protein QBZ16_002212 [Prototheca wickerhamii]